MKTKLLRPLQLLLITLLLSQNLVAQNPNHPWSIGLGVGILDYKGDLGNGLFRFQVLPYTINSIEVKNRPGIAVLTVARYLNQKFDVAMNGHWGEWGFYNKSNDVFFYRNSRYIDANIRWKFLKTTPKHFEPFALAGLGFRNLAENTITAAQNELVVPIGLGAKVPFNERWGLTLQTNLGLTTGDFGDANTGGGKDLLWNHQLVLSYALGKPLVPEGDADKDGVTDSKDKCPNTPEGVKVDKDGCEIDTDKDGIVDRLDKCPEVPGVPALNGCPDKDNDGVADADDKCPETPGEVALSGCPDKDKDGIADKDDKCPDEAGLPALNGCPDRDKDGIADKDDKCPDEFGPASNNGCPEKKPDPTPPTPPNPGPDPKPNPKPEPKPIRDTIEVQSVRFKLNSAELTAESIERLEKAIAFMKENTSYTLLLSGHTDNIGSAAYNLELSKRRAISVKNYLVGKGVPASRIKTRGFGLKYPMSTNETEEGRFENRRVMVEGIK